MMQTRRRPLFQEHAPLVSKAASSLYRSIQGRIVRNSNWTEQGESEMQRG